MLSCLEVLLTGGEIILKLLVIIFIPAFLFGTLMMVTGGTISDPVPAGGPEVTGEYLCCVGTALVFGVITLAAGIRRAFGG